MLRKSTKNPANGKNLLRMSTSEMNSNYKSNTFKSVSNRKNRFIMKANGKEKKERKLQEKLRLARTLTEEQQDTLLDIQLYKLKRSSSNFSIHLSETLERRIQLKMLPMTSQSEDQEQILKKIFFKSKIKKMKKRKCLIQNTSSQKVFLENL